MRDLHVAAVKVVVGKNGAAHRADHNAAVLQFKVGQGLTYEFMQDAMSTAGTIVCGCRSGTALAWKFGI